MSLVHAASARREQVGAALLYNILDYIELGIAAIPEDKTCSDKPQQWSRPKTSASNGPILFSEIQFVHHTYGKRKAEAAALRMEEHNNYWACPEPLRTISEEQIRQFCTRLESHQKMSLFATVRRANDCKPLAIELASPPNLQVDENAPVSSVVPCASVNPEEVVLNRVLLQGRLWQLKPKQEDSLNVLYCIKNANGG